MQPYLRTQKLQRLQDPLRSGGKEKSSQPKQLKLRISELPTKLVLLFCSGQNFLTAMIVQRNLKKTWVHENIVKESKTLLLFDLVLKLKWQNQNALPRAIGFALPFRALPVSARGICLNLLPLALQDHCSCHSSNKLANKSGFNLPRPERQHLQMHSWLNYQV